MLFLGFVCWYDKMLSCIVDNVMLVLQVYFLPFSQMPVSDILADCSRVNDVSHRTTEGESRYYIGVTLLCPNSLSNRSSKIFVDSSHTTLLVSPYFLYKA